MKIAQPKLPIQFDEGSISMMIGDGELENVRLYDEEAINCNVAGLSLNSVVIEKVQFTGAHFSRIVARDLSVRQTDFSSAYLDNGMIVRVEFVNCRMTRVDFSKTSLHDVVFRGCKLDEANLRFADLRRVQFVDCTFTTTEFIGATFHDVTFEPQLPDITDPRSLKGITVL